MLGECSLCYCKSSVYVRTPHVCLAAVAMTFQATTCSTCTMLRKLLSSFLRPNFFQNSEVNRDSYFSISNAAAFLFSQTLSLRVLTQTAERGAYSRSAILTLSLSLMQTTPNSRSNHHNRNTETTVIKSHNQIMTPLLSITIKKVKNFFTSPTN